MPVQGPDRVADRREHALDLVVTPLGEHQFHALWREQPRPRGPRRPILQDNPFPKPCQGLFRGLPGHLGHIPLRQVFVRGGAVLDHPLVIGEEQQPRRVPVQAAHGVPLEVPHVRRQDGAQSLEDRSPSLRIRPRHDDALWLVEHQHVQRGFQTVGPTIHEDVRAQAHRRERLQFQAALHLHPPVSNGLLGLLLGHDARTPERPGQPVRALVPLHGPTAQSRRLQPPGCLLPAHGAGLLARPRRPLPIEGGEDQRIAPLALDEGILPEVGLLAHPQFLHHPHGGMVAGIAVRPDPVKAQRSKAEVQQRLGGLGDIAPPPLRTVEDVPERPFALLGVSHLQATAANEALLLAEDHRQVVDASGGRIHRGPGVLDVLLTLLGRADVMRLVTDHFRIGLVGPGGPPVLQFELPQTQPSGQQFHGSHSMPAP
ncbi:hypothetical protein STIAU_1218, partial [Stigmatella aurantiaca DW4/3-1]